MGCDRNLGESFEESPPLMTTTSSEGAEVPAGDQGAAPYVLSGVLLAGTAHRRQARIRYLWSLLQQMKNEMYSDHDSSSAEKPRGTNHVYIHFYNTDRMRFTLLGADTVPANSESSATITGLSPEKCVQDPRASRVVLGM